MSNALLVALAKSVADLRQAFTTLSRQQGPQGDKGETGTTGADGPPGPDGKPGRDGIDGRDGKAGAVGPPGKPGRDGPPGRDGKDGKDGEEGAVGPMPKHQWRGTELRFQKSKTAWGQWVDLKGPAGSGGGALVINNETGGGGFDPNNIPVVETIEPGDEMILVRNGKLVRVAAQAPVVPTNAVTVDGVPVTVNGQYVIVS